jgi:DNA repair protein RadC
MQIKPLAMRSMEMPSTWSCALMGHVCFAVVGRKGSLVHIVPALHPSHSDGFRVLSAFSHFTTLCPRRIPRRGANIMGLTRDSKGSYKLTGKTTELDVLAAAENILKAKLERLGSLSNPTDASDFLRMRLGALLHEEFHILWLDNRHRILDCQKLFTGTVDGASVHPREVVRAALNINACAAILAHNHPSGVAEPSAADRAITTELRNALTLIGVRILDHIVVAAGHTVSMASRGLL